MERLDSKRKKQVGWELQVLMAKNHIRSASELSRRLKKIGVNLTGVHLSRLVNERPARLNLKLLDALITLFDCEIEELMPTKYLDHI